MNVLVDDIYDFHVEQWIKFSTEKCCQIHEFLIRLYFMKHEELESQMRRRSAYIYITLVKCFASEALK